MFHYVISGLTVASDLAMPGLIEAERATGEAEVTIARGPVPDHLPQATDSGVNWQIAADRFVLRIPGIVRLLLEQGRKITWQCEDDTRPADAAIFVSGSGFGLLMHQRGRCVLHASAVAVGDRAVLFCGPSGAGKSTLAAALAKDGHSLLADDQCVLSGLEHGAPLVHPDGRAMKLWEKAIERLDLAEASGAPVRSELRKFFVAPAAARLEPLPLAAIYVLQEARGPQIRQGRALTIAPLNLAEAGAEVRRNAYRPAMIGRLDQGAVYLQAAAGAVAAGGVFRLTRPMDFAAMADVLGALREHWQTLRLDEAAA